MEEKLRELFRQLNLGRNEGEETPREKVLQELSAKGVARHIEQIQSSENKRKIVVMAGAGISTAAGIPDFRSPGTGLYDNLKKYNLPEPMAVFDIGFFRANPKPFFHLAKELYPGKFKPTISHYFVRLLAEKGLLLRHYTQNIDTLERRAGIDGELLVEAHGSYHMGHCIDCGKEYSHQFVKDLVFADKVPLCTVPKCGWVKRVTVEKEKEKEEEKEKEGGGGGEEKDGGGENGEGKEEYHGLVKPDIVFFGESLPPRFAHLCMEDMPKCELLLILGTSLTVHPFASLADRVSDTCPRLLINREKVGQVEPLMQLLMGGGAGLDFDSDSSYRDVFLQGTCDDGCIELARLLGWEEELMELYQKEHKKLDETSNETAGSSDQAGKTN